MIMDQRVTVKGVDDKLIISIKDSNWTDGNKNLREYIQDNKKFLEKAKIILNVKDLVIRSNDLFDLRNFLNDNEVFLTSIISTQEETNTSANLLGLKNQLTEKTKPIPRKDINTILKPASIVRKTIRSGMIIEDECDVIVMGEVNPGSVIKAGGNIIVWGKLLGEVHAGKNGDYSSIVAALEMNPSLITIAGVQFEGSKRKAKEPEVAVIKDNNIQIYFWKNISY